MPRHSPWRTWAHSCEAEPDHGSSAVDEWETRCPAAAAFTRRASRRSALPAAATGTISRPAWLLRDSEVRPTTRASLTCDSLWVVPSQPALEGHKGYLGHFTELDFGPPVQVQDRIASPRAIIESMPGAEFLRPNRLAVDGRSRDLPCPHARPIGSYSKETGPRGVMASLPRYPAGPRGELP
jgi:hypothetical protein